MRAPNRTRSREPAWRASLSGRFDAVARPLVGRPMGARAEGRAQLLDGPVVSATARRLRAKGGKTAGRPLTGEGQAARRPPPLVGVGRHAACARELPAQVSLGRISTRRRPLPLGLTPSADLRCSGTGGLEPWYARAGKRSGIGENVLGTPIPPPGKSLSCVNFRLGG